MCIRDRAIAFAALFAGYLWALFAGKKFTTSEDSEAFSQNLRESIKLPSAAKSLMPILVPILLIAARSVAAFPSKPFGNGIFFDFLNLTGQPVNALLIGFLLSLLLFPVFKMCIRDRIATPHR